MLINILDLKLIQVHDLKNSIVELMNKYKKQSIYLQEDQVKQQLYKLLLNKKWNSKEIRNLELRLTQEYIKNKKKKLLKKINYKKF